MVSRLEFVTQKPEIFQRSDLDSLVYAQTRRNPSDGDPLSGNVGLSPMILGETNYARTDSPLSYAAWRAQEFGKASIRLHYLKRLTGITHIASPRLPHGTDLINLDTDFEKVSIDIPFEEQASADASLFTKAGIADLKATGDCAVVTGVWPGAEAIVTMHVGIRGAAKEIIPHTLAQVAAKGLNPADASYYIGPHAHIFQMSHTEVDELNEIIAQGSSEVKHEYRIHTLSTPQPYPALNLSSIITHQLERSRVLPGEIQISAENTLHSPYYHSNYTTIVTGTPDGRFANLIGKLPPKSRSHRS
jgi:copper oxidase (laccase) domain-containing protein